MEYDVYISRRSCGTCGVTIVPSPSQYKEGLIYENWRCPPLILCHTETRSAIDNICKYLDGRLQNKHFFYGLIQEV